MIIDGVTSITTDFSITYSYSASGSCTMIVPLSCDQQQWCKYTLILDNCPVMTSGNGMFSVVPLNVIGSGTTRNSDLIGKYAPSGNLIYTMTICHGHTRIIIKFYYCPTANRNPLFSVTDHRNINSPSKRLQLMFQTTFTLAECLVKYGLMTSTECTNFNLNATIVSTDSDVIIVNVTLLQSGKYCYRINCTVAPSSLSLTPIAQGMFEYQRKSLRKFKPCI